jgi:hypothetical protein
MEMNESFPFFTLMFFGKIRNGTLPVGPWIRALSVKEKTTPKKKQWKPGAWWMGSLHQDILS